MTSRDLARQAMDDIVAWLIANGIEPSAIPESEVPQIADGQITCVAFLPNGVGRKYVDEATGKAATGVLVMPLLVEPPPSLAARLASGSPDG